MFDLEKLKESYCGDWAWLKELENQVKNNESKIENVENVYKLIQTLYAMNYVIIETETEDYAEKYYNETHEIYAQMKYDLTTMIGINEFWEMV